MLKGSREPATIPAMSFINPREKEINCKVVYYGAPFAGKSTSIRYLYEKTAAGHKSSLISLSNEEDGSLFFDFLPLSLGNVNGYKVRFHLYTVPGQIIYHSSRNLIMKGTDGVIFVIDSQIDKLEQNLESWKNLEINLRNHDADLHTIPLALQYNKQDLKNVLPASDLGKVFNTRDWPAFETVAKKGKNVMECFQSVAKKVLLDLRK